MYAAHKTTEGRIAHATRVFWSLYGRTVWDAERSEWKSPQVKRIVDVLLARRQAPRERVLDAGCGTGSYAIALAEAGFQVTGIDYAGGMLQRARAKAPAHLGERLAFRQTDLNEPLDLPDASQHHIINISVLQTVRDPSRTLDELWRVLQPGGTLLLLHVPRPASHDLPLRQTVAYRAGRLERWTPWRVALIALKALAERWSRAQYWTVDEIHTMLESSHFVVEATDAGPPNCGARCEDDVRKRG